MVRTVVNMTLVEDDCVASITWSSTHVLTIDGAEAAAKAWVANHLLPTPQTIHVLTVKENV